MNESEPSGVPELETAHLRLRAYRADDVEPMFALYSDPRVMRYWSFPPWVEIAQARIYINRCLAGMDSGEIFPWAIADRDSDRLIGALTLFSLHADQLRAEIGYSLSPDFQGRGLATEALQSGLAYAFDELGLVRVEADIDPRNEPSCRLLERIGFEREGLLRKRWRVNDEVCDSAFYGLLVEDFIRAEENPSAFNQPARAHDH